MAEYNEEQLNALVAEKLAEARKGFFTEEDLNKKVTAEVDRRVQSGIEKGIETQKEKWEREYAERAKMTAEELARKEFEEKLNELSTKEKELYRKSNYINALDKLAGAGIPKNAYEPMLGALVSDDNEVTTANIDTFINVFKNTSTEIETKVKTEFGKIPPPKTGGSNTVITKDDFNKMGYADKVKFKQDNPDIYKKFISN